ncbi:MAG: carboxypeptidase-like regulatory domain-containing protein [Duncaniella sp.]|nr:carboxypeptidase-like regulatory domain-containing protein [Duncaniella sp.]
MRLKLFLLMMLAAVMPALAQKTGVAGTVVDSNTGSPVAGASVMLENQSIVVTTGAAGDFSITTATPGSDVLVIAAYGYNDKSLPVEIAKGLVSDLGQIPVVNSDLLSTYYEDQNDMYFDQELLDDEEAGAQTITALTGASDNIYYNAAQYDFSVMRFRMRGYDSQYQSVSVNGVNLNDLARGRFNYSSIGGMNRAFRNKNNSIGMDAAFWSFGDIGGSTDMRTLASDYAPGFYGSAAYTNSAYMFRAMAQYSTGLTKNGWAVTLSAIGRYADEGVVPGTFYNSGGLFLSVQKMLGKGHSLNLTAWGAPTQRATNSATYEEAYDLAGSNLYNPNWGWQDGKKRSAKIVETFDPTAILNWLWKKNSNTTLNTAAAIRWVNYSTSALNWYNAADPRPDYYRYLPSYYKDDEEAYQLYTDLWKNQSFRQLDWGKFYSTNRMNAEFGRGDNPDNLSSTYILENRHSNQFNFILNSTLNTRLNEHMTLQGGVSLNYTRAHYYKTVRDLLGGAYWIDLDQYSERDFPDQPGMLQNDLNNPNRKVGKGDTFGYDYYINAIQATAWLQNMITLPHWDINYGLKISYTQFQRDGKMRNGRAPDNSYGKGLTHRFDNAGIKAGATYKIDGRNFFMAHAEYETRAPLFEYAYISPRIKDTAIDGLANERIFSADLSYVWNYRRFRGSITGFWTEMYDMTERTSFYDDQYSTFMNYVLKGVHRSYKGVEIGMAFKITPSVTLEAAGTFARYQYKNRPTGVRSYENGMMPDTAQVVYLKNFYVGGTPQTAVNIGIDWAAPKSWFFNINASWMDDAYVSLSPIRHEALPNLWQKYPDPEVLEAKMTELAHQDKLNDAFVLNASIGKVIYINRKVSLNLNLNVDNILNNRKIQTYGYQQGRFDYTNYDANKYPNRYFYAQGIKVYFNVGVRF